ncbi:MAG: DUF202 domain-containing protein [Actinomycetes bacterium]
MTSQDDGHVPDLGSQLERTALAWQRTALVLALNGALLTRSSSALGTTTFVLGIGVLCVSAAVWVAAARGYRDRFGSQSGSLMAGNRTANVALTAFVALLALLNAFAALTHVS